MVRMSLLTSCSLDSHCGCSWVVKVSLLFVCFLIGQFPAEFLSWCRQGFLCYMSRVIMSWPVVLFLMLLIDSIVLHPMLCCVSWFAFSYDKLIFRYPLFMYFWVCKVFLLYHFVYASPASFMQSFFCVIIWPGLWFLFLVLLIWQHCLVMLHHGLDVSSN